MHAEDESLEGEIRDEIARGSDPDRPVRRWLQRVREQFSQHPRLRFAYVAVVTLLGVTTVVVGLLLVPLPGPGWLVVFIGLSILGTEFVWARRLTVWARNRLERVLLWWAARRDRQRRR